MANTFASFDKRLTAIDKKNRKLSRSYRNKIAANGLIQPRACRGSRDLNDCRPQAVFDQGPPFAGFPVGRRRKPAGWIPAV